jgi:4'-phosphopantetheinyl transferase
MNLTPRIWTWDGPRPRAGWLDECSPDVPVVWQAWLTDDPATRLHLLPLLSAEERARFERFKLPEDQQRFLAGRGLLRILVGAQMNRPDGRVKFSFGPSGKPQLAAEAGTPALHFNVSHSGKLVLLAFHPAHEVGVDVEAVRREPDWEPVARQIFSAEDHGDWARLKPGERAVAFFRAWTRHEAGLKAMGLGFAGENHAVLDSRVERFDLVLPEGYQGAVGLQRDG